MTTNIDPGADLDTRIEAASNILQKVAQEEGIELESLGEEKIAELLRDILNPTTETTETTTKEAMATTTETPEITAAQVSLELTKRAALESIDLATLPPADYEELFNKVAEELTDPQYAEKVAAFQEEQEKVAAQTAQMDELGRVAARGFHDELKKLAAEDEEKEKDDKGKGDMPFPPKKKDGDKDDDKDEKKEAQAKLAAAAARLTKTASAPKSAFVEEQALKVAQQMLLDSGIDPATGEKIASEDEINARAKEILREKGYEV